MLPDHSHRVWKFCIVMGIVGSIDNSIVAQEFNRERQGRFIRVARKEELLTACVLTRQLLQGSSFLTEERQHGLVFLIKPFDEVGDPPYARFEKCPAQLRESVEDTTENELPETNHVRHRDQGKRHTKVSVDNPL